MSLNLKDKIVKPVKLVSARNWCKITPCIFKLQLISLSFLFAFITKYLLQTSRYS